MEKTITVSKSGKTFFVRIQPETIDNRKGLLIKVLHNYDDAEPLVQHFLDFSKHPDSEKETNMNTFIKYFSDNEANEWVQIWLDKNK